MKRSRKVTTLNISLFITYQQLMSEAADVRAVFCLVHVFPVRRCGFFEWSTHCALGSHRGPFGLTVPGTGCRCWGGWSEQALSCPLGSLWSALRRLQQEVPAGAGWEPTSCPVLRPQQPERHLSYSRHVMTVYWMNTQMDTTLKIE